MIISWDSTVVKELFKLLSGLNSILINSSTDEILKGVSLYLSVNFIDFFMSLRSYEYKWVLSEKQGI